MIQEKLISLQFFVKNNKRYFLKINPVLVISWFAKREPNDPSVESPVCEITKYAITQFCWGCFSPLDQPAVDSIILVNHSTTGSSHTPSHPDLAQGPVTSDDLSPWPHRNKSMWPCHPPRRPWGYGHYQWSGTSDLCDLKGSDKQHITTRYYSQCGKRNFWATRPKKMSFICSIQNSNCPDEFSMRPAQNAYWWVGTVLTLTHWPWGYLDGISKMQLSILV